jgi:hypothetical protein
LLAASSAALRPCEGGVLELSGVFGGRPSLASSSATRARSAAFSAFNAKFSASNFSKRAESSSTRANSRVIAASLSAGPGVSEAGERAIHRLTHIRRLDASPFTPSESIDRTRPNRRADPQTAKGEVSKYPSSAAAAASRDRLLVAKDSQQYLTLLAHDADQILRLAGCFLFNRGISKHHRFDIHTLMNPLIFKRT